MDFVWGPMGSGLGSEIRKGRGLKVSDGGSGVPVSNPNRFSN